MTTKAKKDKLWSLPFIFASLAFLSSALGMQILNNSISLYAQSLGKNMAFSGRLALFFALAAIIARFFSGRLSDKIGRRPIMCIGMLLFALTTFGMGLFPSVFALCLFRFLQGIGFSFGNTATLAAGSDVLPDSRIGEGVGFLGLGNSISGAVAAAIALALINGSGYVTLFSTTAVIILAGVVLGFFCRYKNNENYLSKLEMERKKNNGVDEASKQKGLRAFIETRALKPSVTQFISSFSNASMITFLTVYGTQREIENISLFFTISAVTMLIMRIITSKVADRFNPVVILAPAYILSAISCVMLAFTYNSYVFYLCGFLYGVSQGCMQPVNQAIAVKLSPPSRFGAANATFNIFVDAGVGLGGLFWGVIIDSFGFGTTYLMAAGTFLIGVVFSIIFYRKGVVSYSEQGALKT